MIDYIKTWIALIRYPRYTELEYKKCKHNYKKYRYTRLYKKKIILSKAINLISGILFWLTFLTPMVLSSIIRAIEEIAEKISDKCYIEYRYWRT